MAPHTIKNIDKTSRQRSTVKQNDIRCRWRLITRMVSTISSVLLFGQVKTVSFENALVCTGSSFYPWPNLITFRQFFISTEVS